MNCNGNGNCSFDPCGCVPLIVSVVVGALVGVLFAFGLIPFITTFVWIAFGLGVLALIFLLAGNFTGATTGPNALTRCLCRITTCLQAGIWGTILTAIVALAFPLVPVVLVADIVVAILAFFFILMVFGLIGLISCISCRICVGS